MDFPLISLLHGIVIGIIISLPLGPVGLITMKRTADFGLKAGITAGFAIVLIDTIAAIIVLIGLHKTLPYLRVFPGWVHIIGGILVLCYGIYITLTPPKCNTDETKGWEKHFLHSVGVALSNPSTYISFGAIALLLARYIHKPFFTKIEVVVGFFIGAFLWWSMLARVAFKKRKYLQTTTLQRLIGIVIIILAVLTLVGPNHIRATGNGVSSFISAIL